LPKSANLPTLRSLLIAAVARSNDDRTLVRETPSGFNCRASLRLVDLRDLVKFDDYVDSSGNRRLSFETLHEETPPS
jgi:hypothetical protein